MSHKIDRDKLETARKIAEDTGLQSAEEYLNSVGVVSFGIESIHECDHYMSYINLGNTYDATICQEGDEFWVGLWGIWHEEAEQEYCEEENVIRCGYCGEFTPLEEGTDWRDCVCENCGHLVGG
jgi:hypothetical protein